MWPTLIVAVAAALGCWIGRKRGITTLLAVDLAVGAFVWLCDGLGASWITLLVLLSAILFVVWTAFITAIWWLAPTFQSLRDGSLPMLPPFPVRSLQGPALLAVEMGCKAYLVVSYGILALLAIDACLAVISKLRQITSTSSAS